MAVKQKILIVDDDANIAELISLYLLKECYDTKIVEDGESALREFKTYQPNLILLDLMLPGIDGYQVCREIRTQSNIPIIMLSAKGEVFDKVLGLELGADDYIIKPFDSKELVARVKAVLRRYQVMKPEKAEPEIKCVELQYIKGLYTSVIVNNKGTEQQDSFVLWNLRGSYRVCNFANIFVKGENLLAQRYEINAGYPMPKATFMGGINLNF